MPPVAVAVMDPLLALHVAVVDEAVIEGAEVLLTVTVVELIQPKHIFHRDCVRPCSQAIEDIAVYEAYAINGISKRQQKCHLLL